MEYGTIPYLDKKVSKIIFGMAIPPYIMGNDNDELLDAVIASGINTFDLARNYGLSEFAFGKWMEKRGNREDIAIISKCGHPDMFGRKRITRRDILNDLRSTLKALKTSYVDIYLLHRDDESVPVGKIIELFNELYKEGKIKAFGASNWSYKRIKEANEYAKEHGLIPFSVTSPNYSLARQVADPWGGGCVTISGDENKEARDYYENSKMPVLAYSALGRGFFSGKLKNAEIDKANTILDGPAYKGYYSTDNVERLKRCEEIATKKNVLVSQIALKYIFKNNLDMYAIVSSTHIENITSNIKALDINLSDKETKYLNLECNNYE